MLIGKIIEGTTKLIDVLVPIGYIELQQYEVLLKARLTVSILFLSGLSCLIAPSILPFAETLPGHFVDLAYYGMYGSGIVFLATLIFFHYTGSFFISANIYAVTSFLTLYFESLIIGGPLHNPISLLNVVIPMVVFLIAGKYVGIFWTAVNIIYFASAFDPTGTSVPSYSIDPKVYNHIQLIIWSILSCCVLVGFLIFDLMNGKLRYMISVERNHYQFEAGHDKLTGLLNRSSFQERLSNTVRKAEVNNMSSLVGLIDLDGFKPINDEIGHHAGDIVLKEISTRLRAAIRNTDTVARLGGDEFAFILENFTDPTAIDRSIQSMLDVIAQPIKVEDKEVRVTGSIGLARCPEDTIDAEAVIRAADMAMYAAKEEKGRFIHYKDMQDSQREEASLASAASQA